MKKVFVLNVKDIEYELGSLDNNTQDEILEAALELIAYIRGVKFVHNISSRLYTSNLDQRLGRLFEGKDKLEFTKEVFIQSKTIKQFNKGA
ncbi:MAG: hypothetical protein KHZ90_08575 [Veillonella parvula]|uniref:Uncharacterized protein n=1 Tax=Veillonella parvula TaxID=29466 RepID=A0A943A6W5_VEIPA|nr:hypothetical protein [Veillonella parvula]MBS4893816.1 hypothetical protein [Veillonella parvula]